MSDIEISTAQKEKLQSSYGIGLVTLYSLPAAMESIVLRVVSPEGGEPQEGGKYIVEFRHPETGEVQEILEEDEETSLDPKSISFVMDDLAEDYLRSVAADWEVYVAQSGRCDPNEASRNDFERAEVMRTVIREL